MKKILLLFISFIISVSLFGQKTPTEDLYQITPDWQLNDEVKATSKSSTKIWANDTLITNLDVTSDYYIKIIDTIGVYRLRYSMKSNQLELDLSSQMPEVSKYSKVVVDLIKKIGKECESLEFIVKVNKETGLAEELENKDAIILKIKEITKNTLVELQKSLNPTKVDNDSLNLLINSFVKEYEAEIVQSSINGINYIFQAYSYSFPMNGTIRQPTMVYPINTIGVMGDKEMPATLILSSKENTDNTIDVSVETEYDKLLILLEIKKSNDAFKKLTAKDIELVEKEKVKFNIDNSWILNHESFVSFTMPKVKVEQKTTTTFTLVKINPPSPKTNTTDYFQKGFDAANEGKYEEAIKYYSLYLQQTNPDDVNTLFNIALAYYNSGKYEKSLAYYKLVLAKDKNDPGVYNGLGNTYDELGQFELAITNYKMAIKLDPTKSDYYYNIGNSYLEIKNNEEAIKSYLQSITLNPNSPEVFNNLGNAYFAVGKEKEQIECYKKAAKLGYVDAQNWLKESGISW